RADHRSGDRSAPVPRAGFSGIGLRESPDHRVEKAGFEGAGPDGGDHFEGVPAFLPSSLGTYPARFGTTRPGEFRPAGVRTLETVGQARDDARANAENEVLTNSNEEARKARAKNSGLGTRRLDRADHRSGDRSAPARRPGCSGIGVRESPDHRLEKAVTLEPKRVIAF